MLTSSAIETFAQDLRYAIRQLRTSPGFAVTALLTLALGIGANTAIFTVVRSVLLKPLAYPDPDRLVRISAGATSMRFEEIKTNARSYSGVGAFRGGVENVTLSGAPVPEVLNEARVSANFLRILGTGPLLGRSFRPDEDSPSAPPVAMISAELWHRRFAADRSLLGRTATIDTVPYTIVGVLPPRFQFPFPDVDVWVTQPYYSMSRFTPYLEVFGRLRSGVTIGQANAELAVLNRQYANAHPGMLDIESSARERITPVKDELVANVRSMLWILFGAVGFVLLIACANVASLLLARATSRSREFAVRAALGASRGRLIGQLLSESVVLSIAGGALGALLARWSLTGITQMTALDLPRVGEIRIDGTVLAFTLAVSIATGILFGTIPSLGAARPDVAPVLRAGEESLNSPASHGVMLWLSPRAVLVIGQVALSMVLLIGATLLMQSFVRLNRIDPGFQPAHLLTMQISLPPSRYGTDQKKAAFYEDLVRRVESLPRVRTAAVTWTLPFTGFARTPVQLANEHLLKLNQRQLAIIQAVTPAYFRTLKVPFRRGREFTARDRLDSTPVAIINESLARRFWPGYPKGENPIGQRILVGASSRPIEVVGIVADVRQSLEVDPMPGIFRPCSQAPLSSAMLAVRTEGDPLQLVSSVRRELTAIDPDQAASAVRTMDELAEADQGQRRVILTLLGLFAGAALLLTLIGVYGIVAYSVVHRARELGIRRALGAQEGNILWLVIKQCLRLAVAGVFIGVAGALALTRVIQALLFHVSATDPFTFATVALAIVSMALLASYIPARRAASVDPAEALRSA